MIKYADVIIDLSYGDCGKGKVSYCLSQDYDIIMRTSGGMNAGHTIFHNGKKFVLHMVPCGIFHGKRCVIGNGCVLNIKSFQNELSMLEENGVDTKGLIFIASNAHIVSDEHIQEELNESKVGTTKRGIGPAYRDKVLRVGKRAIDCPELKEYVVDLHHHFFDPTQEYSILCEGAQGFGLDIDWGDYPFVTSSNCGVASVVINGIPPQKIRKVIGVIKPYETYVGAKQFQPESDETLKIIQKVGQEVGATTGRVRQCNWLNINNLKKAIELNGVDHIVINKTDVFQDVGAFWLYDESDKLKGFWYLEHFMDYVENTVDPSKKILFKWSYSPNKI